MEARKTPTFEDYGPRTLRVESEAEKAKIKDKKVPTFEELKLYFFDRRPGDRGYHEILKVSDSKNKALDLLHKKLARIEQEAEIIKELISLLDKE